MNKAEAEAALARLPLKVAVLVADVTDALGKERRRYAFGNTTIEIDADSTDEQLAGLARHLPLADKDRAAALDALKSAAVATVEAVATKGTP